MTDPSPAIDLLIMHVLQSLIVIGTDQIIGRVVFRRINDDYLKIFGTFELERYLWIFLATKVYCMLG